MIDFALDKNTLIRLADSVSGQCDFPIGIYDVEGEDIHPNSAFSRTDVMSAIAKLGKDSIESIADLNDFGNRISAVAMRHKNTKLVGIWLIKENLESPHNFDKCLAMVDTIVSVYMLSRENEVSLSKDIEDKEKEGGALSLELAKNEIITKILARTESEEEFSLIAKDMLAMSAEYLMLSHILLIEKTKEDKIGLICEWNESGKESLGDRIKDEAFSQLPFTDKLSYTVSTDSHMPDAFMAFSAAYNISAGIYLPVVVDESDEVYLIASMELKERHWSLKDAGFLNDIRKMLSLVFLKRRSSDILENTNLILNTVLDHTDCGIIAISKVDGEIVFKNTAYTNMLRTESDRTRFLRKLQNTPEIERDIEEYYLEDAKKYISAVIGIVRWIDDNYVRLVTVFDITKLKESEKNAEKLANTDELTGIYNRAHFIKELSGIFSSKHNPGAVLFLNIGGFNEINVTMGNDSGDNLLSSIGKFMLKLSNENARVYRLGADEFALVILNSSMIDPAKMAEDIVKRFRMPWQLKYKDCYLSVSVGIGLYPADADDVGTIVKYAGIALSNARKKGSGAIVFFEKRMEDRLKESILIRSFLKDCTENGCSGMELKKYRMSYRICNADFVTDMCEYIWNAPDVWESATAFDYMPIARKENLTGAIYKKLIEELAKECRNQNDFGYPDLCMGVAMDVEDFISCDIEKYVIDAINESKVNPERILIALRGAPSLRDISSVKERIVELKKMGVHIACAYLPDCEKYGVEFDAQPSLM